MSVELIRVRTAIDLLDAAAHEEGITPDTYLGAWAVVQRDLVQALYALELTREVQSEDVLAKAKAVTEASAETMRLQVEAMQIELRKIDRHIEQSKITLGRHTDETVKALMDIFTDKVRDVLVARARAWSQTRYLQTAGGLAFAGFLLLGAGYWAGASRPGNGAPHDFLQQCASSLRRDATMGRTFCAVEVPTR